jgi:hypothetical protein
LLSAGTAAPAARREDADLGVGLVEADARLEAADEADVARAAIDALGGGERERRPELAGTGKSTWFGMTPTTV